MSIVHAGGVPETVTLRSYKQAIVGEPLCDTVEAGGRAAHPTALGCDRGRAVVDMLARCEEHGRATNLEAIRHVLPKSGTNEQEHVHDPCTDAGSKIWGFTSTSVHALMLSGADREPC